MCRLRDEAQRQVLLVEPVVLYLDHIEVWKRVGEDCKCLGQGGVRPAGAVFADLE